MKPMLVQYQLFQTLGTHCQTCGLYRVKRVGKLIQKILINGVFQISHSHICFTLGTHGMHGEGKVRRTHPAAD